MLLDLAPGTGPAEPLVRSRALPDPSADVLNQFSGRRAFAETITRVNIVGSPRCRPSKTAPSQMRPVTLNGQMTSLAIKLSPESTRRARHLHSMGFALICLAFALPFLLAAIGKSNAFQAGESLVRNLLALFVLALVAWLATRNRGDMAKAIARLITGMLLILFVGGGIALAANEDELAKAMLKESLAFAAKQSTRFTELGQRFDQVDMNSVVTVNTLTSPPGLATSKATVAQYRALLAERRSLLSSYLSDFERYFATLPPGDFRAGAMSSMGANKAATVKLYGDLDVAQTAWADSISGILEWAEKQTVKLSARGDQLVFKDATQQAELSALVTKLTTTESALNKVIQAAAVQQAAAQDKTKANLAEADKLLAK